MTKSSKRLKYVFLALSLSLFSLVFFHKKTFAAEDIKTKITMSPVEDHVRLDPGAVYKNNVTITNSGKESVTFETEVLPFQVDKNTYVPVYDVSNSYTQITRWITIDLEKETLAPGETTIANYTISVPKDAPGSGQYAAISFQLKDITDEKGVNVNAFANFNIYTRISGVTRETGEIIEQKTSGFLLAPPIKASVKLSNTGNVDQEAKITVDMENAITGERLYSNADSPKTTLLLPETEKTVDLTFDNVLRLGVMRLNMTTDYINNHEKISRIIIICPIWVIFILVAIILLIVYKIASKKHNNSKKRSNSRGYETPSKDFNI